ncbi:MAG: arsenate reductase ArsC [Acidimicrobiales bacterium]
MATLAEMTIEQQHLLRTAAANLRQEFDGTFGQKTIEEFLASSYEQFATGVKALNFVPLLAERFARQRLRALARIEGRANDGVPVVLFLCVHNAGRSQMALGWFNHLAGDRAIAWSGGSEPGAAVNPSAIAAMAEIGIDIRQEFPKPWTQEIVQAADVVITMGCGDACPIFPPASVTRDWLTTRRHGRDRRPSHPGRDRRPGRKLLAGLEVDSTA